MRSTRSVATPRTRCATSPSVYITRRQTKSGSRYVVRFRLGGRETQPLHAGSFKTRKEAEARARWVSGELAAMRVPDVRLAAKHGPVTVLAVVDGWLRTRVDVVPATLANYRAARDRIAEGIGREPVVSLSGSQVAEWVAELAHAGVGRTVLERCLALLRGALDEHRDPNPARSRAIRLPRVEREEVNPPPTRHWEAIVREISPHFRLVVRVLEATGLRIGELQALRWGDIDWERDRLHVRSGKTKAARRWVPVPEAVMDELAALVPREDRDLEAAVFPGLVDGSVRMAMRRACAAAGVPLYSPHDLRHRYITLLVRRGVDPVLVAALVGHTRKSLTLDVYSNLFMGEEV